MDIKLGWIVDIYNIKNKNMKQQMQKMNMKELRYCNRCNGLYPNEDYEVLENGLRSVYCYDCRRETL